MNNMLRKNNKFIILGICILLLVALISTINTSFEVKEDEVASAAVIVSTAKSRDGKLFDENQLEIRVASADYALGEDGRFHMTDQKCNSLYAGKTIVSITNGDQLMQFIESCQSSSNANRVGILKNNIEYDMSTVKDSSSNTKTNSTADFYGILDGNGYYVNMTPPAGGSILALNSSCRGLAGDVAGANWKGYSYAGMLCAVNRGTFKNLTVNWLRRSSKALNSEAEMSTGYGVLKNSSNKNSDTTVAGIFCGLNYGGTIFNCQLNVVGAFAIAQIASDTGTDENYNSCLVGGFTGVFKSGTIERCTLDNNGGILALAEGSRNSVYSKKARSACGGFAAIMNTGAAYIKNITMRGSGNVNSKCGHEIENRNNDGFDSYPGGAIGSTFHLEGKTGITFENLVEGQIEGIISSWTGATVQNWKDGKGEPIQVNIKYGLLFDGLGDNAAECISNVYLMFDYTQLINEHTAVGQTAKYSLDSAGNIGWGNWIEIFAANDKGTVDVSYDFNKYFVGETEYIRMAIMSDGFVSVDSEFEFESTRSTHAFKKSNGGTGTFIWSFGYSANSQSGHGVIDTVRLNAQDNVGAYVYYFDSSLDISEIICVFGEKVKFEYENNNNALNTGNYISDNSKVYDGEPILYPTPKLVRSNNETFVFNPAATDLTIFGYIGGLKYNLSNVENLQPMLKVPGSYEFSYSKKVGGKTYLYYDDTQYVLAETSYRDGPISAGTIKTIKPYEYTIQPGGSRYLQSFASSNSVNWLAEDTISFNYQNKAGMMSHYTYAMGAAQESEYIEVNSSDVNINFDVDISGNLRYTFNAYVENPFHRDDIENSQQYIKIGSTKIEVYIDNKKPEITDIEYYDYNSYIKYENGQLSSPYRISTVQLEEWQDRDILVKYRVTDFNHSGIESGSGHLDYEESGKNWICKVVLTGVSPSKTVVYRDAAGNESDPVTFSALIDTTPTSLDNVKTVNYTDYLTYYAKMGYCPVSVKISFTPRFGLSGAYLMYSFEKDENNQDIWIRYDRELEANKPNTFVIDFEMMNTNFKMKLVNAIDLYPESLANGDGFVTNGASNKEEAIVWSVKVIIAYIGITLDNVYYNGEKITSLSETEQKALFRRAYNATDIADIDLSIRLYDVIDNGGSSYYQPKAKTSIAYTDKYKTQSPRIDESCLSVNQIYDSANAGNNRSITFSVASIGAYEGKYDVYFVSGDTVYLTVDDLLSAEDDISKEKLFISGITIDKSGISINWNEIDEIKSTYTYGELVVDSIIIRGISGEEIELNTIVKKDGNLVEGYPTIGNYTVNVDFKNTIDSQNYEISTENKNIVFNKKAVMVKLVLDGDPKVNYDITYNGKVHTLTGSYVDAFGNKQIDVTMTYYSDANCLTLVDEAKNMGKYYVKAKIDNENYSILNQIEPYVYHYEFQITRGFLDLDLSTQVYGYTSKSVAFKLITTADIDLYHLKDGKITIEYYKKINGIAQSEKVTNIFEPAEYEVRISISGNSDFMDRVYPSTTLIIEKAETAVSINNTSIVYDGSAHGINLIEAEFEVTSDKVRVIGLNDDNKIVYFTYKNGDVETQTEEIYEYLTITYVASYKDGSIERGTMTKDTKDIFINEGTITFKFIFRGDKYFNKSETNCTFIIEPADIVGVNFANLYTGSDGLPTYDEETNAYNFYYLDKGIDDKDFVLNKEFGIDMKPGSAARTYLEMGAVITFNWDNKAETKYYYDEVEHRIVDEFRILNSDYEGSEISVSTPNGTGTYLYAAVELKNYKTLVLTTNVIVNKTQMKGVTAVPSHTFYDGKLHVPEIVSDFIVKKNYIEGYEGERIIETFIYNDGSGPVTVYVEYDDNAMVDKVGLWKGVIKLTSEEYAAVTLKTELIIDKKEIEPAKIDLSAFEAYGTKITSDTDLTKFGATFKDVNNNNKPVKFEYYRTLTSDGELEDKVELDSDGKLPAGTYYIGFDLGESYFSDGYLKFTVKQAASQGGSTTTTPGGDEGEEQDENSIMDLLKDYWLYIAIGAGAFVVIIVLVIVVSVSKKKKKRNKKRPGGNGGGKPKTRSEKIAAKDKALENKETPHKEKKPEEPTKKKPEDVKEKPKDVKEKPIKEKETSNNDKATF